MDLRLLEVFCRVYVERSFSGAAKGLQLTQPTVSAHIKELEASLHTPLFNRLGRDTNRPRLAIMSFISELAVRDELDAGVLRIATVKGLGTVRRIYYHGREQPTRLVTAHRHLPRLYPFATGIGSQARAAAAARSSHRHDERGRRRAVRRCMDTRYCGCSGFTRARSDPGYPRKIAQGSIPRDEFPHFLDNAANLRVGSASKGRTFDQPHGRRP